MSKPLGVSLYATNQTLGLRVVKPSPVEDAIWDAVEKAIENGWSAQQFKDEASECWEQKLRDEAKLARYIFERK